MSDDRNGSIGWFLAGLGLGALVGVLYAPKSGRETRQAILDDAGPRIREVSLNMAEVSERVRSQAENMDSAMSEVVDRLRLQSIRVDDLVTRTIDKVEETTEMVQQTVITPVKQINGLVH